MATPGRNDPCTCGSGRRFKRCHGKPLLNERNVDFVVAGTQKGGTSALDMYLREHPEICMPRYLKEVHFFDDEAHFARGAGYGFYHGFFEPHASQRVLGEVTPHYMYWEPVAARIRAYNPVMKFIILLRNPATRAYSHWNLEVRKGREHLAFDAALACEDARLAATSTRQHKDVSYVDRGRYSVQLRRLGALFPAGQILVLRSDDLQRDPDATLARIAGFLAIAPFPKVLPRSVNEFHFAAPMSASAAAFLQRALAAEIDELEQMLGWNLDEWRRPAVS